ncbi:hypothetical protein RIF29_41114 [Crotalaria pallida]|uniref:Uncharacterized protein n=1 Tax=Crotalaria pallida TaxID=3830 RepID=A0AAN9E6Q7_CROPI
MVITKSSAIQYKLLIEMKLLAQQRDLQVRIPDIEKCLDVVGLLLHCKVRMVLVRRIANDVSFILSPRNRNSLQGYWSSLLQKNLDNSRASSEGLIANLQFLSDHEVTIA